VVINFLIGIGFLAIMVWLLRGALRKPPTPGELIRRKEEAKRLEQDKVTASLARVGAFSQIRLDELFAAVQDMRGALRSDQTFTAARIPEAVELSFKRGSLRITHHMQEVDLDRKNLSDSYLTHLERFSLETERRVTEEFTDLETLLERLAALILEFSDLDKIRDDHDEDEHEA
jgi:hypothetical protein